MKELVKSLKTNSDDSRNIVSMTTEELQAFRKIRKNLKFDWQIDTYNAYMTVVLTGLRYSDIILLNSSHIKNYEIIMNLEKTDVWVNIPVREELLEIIDYYNGSLVNKLPTIQRLNINLRKILSTIPIFQDKDIEYVHNLKSKKSVECERWERFTFHTSRKTFINLAIKNGCNYAQIKNWVGFQDFRTINFYMGAQKTSNNDRQILNF
jgi:integrase